ncbi:uncharacterized protein MYCFIDRAFT_214631 [Pseudocercospora fijiensis CIRAD86]|uniref:TOG domain-containing protein n=1 Tax=Pseudocercospora fijiensis (strain CIRAD86) TaxID=383855 RepID=M2Z2S2_PSEFD|nr:uncharacterized protein MYCFIDRAFT_214631 [Pseudocercospora fijiensis CIRAD86]EME84150.1 hypothetical protein MYCFIDRAFT_214631 [Pseudocercospora fijiensis CIRAD86]
MGEEEEWAQLPLTDQFQHKNWKARKGGYETATKEFKTAQPSDPIVREFTLDSGLWKGAVGDANAAAQQEALNAYNAFLDAAGTDGARKTRGVTVGPAVEKGLTGRPAAKASALESILLLIELDKPDPVIDEVLPYLSHKTPKMIVAALDALREVYHAYGCKTVEPKPVIKLLPKVFGHADKNVRAQAQALTVELYRWLKEPMKPLFWNELKEVQQKDLDKLFEPVKSEPAPRQERLLRSQQAAKEREVEEAAAGGEEEAEDGGEIDLEPEFEAVDVLAKVPKDFNDRLASTKWKDRKEALDETFAAVNVPAIQEGSFDDIIRACAKSMKDANIAVVTVAANVVECLAKGLRKSFGKYRSQILAPMLERFKEKKASVTDAIGAACDAVFMATGLGDVQADVLEGLKNKNPQVKENSAKFLARCLKTTREAPTPEQTKELAEGAKKLLTESAAPLRDAGCEILGVLWKIMGDRNMLAHLDGLDDIKKNKVKEFSDAAEVKAKWKPKTAAPPARAAGGPGAKKPALGSKRPAPAGAKKPAPPRVTSPPAEDAPLQPRPTSRPVGKPAGGLRPPGTGLKAPGSGLAKPGLKASSAAGAASPKRAGVVYDEPPPAPATPKAGLGRGLAGRPLAKPSAAATSPPQPQRSLDHVSSGLSSVERQELDALRAEVDLVRQQASDLRNEKLKMSSQIAELQVQNAQLIEDHTRDVLQIKAKETQLVRARSDAESAEDRANTLSREIDRLKREISRLSRTQAGRDSPIESAWNGGSTSPRPVYASSRSYHLPPARNYGSIDGIEGKENHPRTASEGKLRGGLGERSDSRPMSNGSSGGRATPALGEDGGTINGSSSLRGSQGDGQESWRRAAEVTQNLKARIEMMKARQNINRGQ